MINIFAVNFNDLADDEFINIDLSRISLNRRNQIERMKFRNNQKASFLAELLLYYYMKNIAGMHNYTIIADNNGKPKFSNHPNLHFNISHSGEWVVCAFSNSKIGIDLEKIKAADMEIAKRFFNSFEYANLTSTENISEKNRLFYILWTLKESYLKNIGIGIKGLTPQLRFELTNNIVCSLNNIIVDKNFYVANIFNDYFLSVCYNKDEMIEPNNLLHILDSRILIDEYQKTCSDPNKF